MLPERIEVIDKYTPKEYDTFGGALNAAKDRINEGKRESEKVRGATIDAYLYSGDQLTLLFSNNRALQIALAQNFVSWKLLDKSSIKSSEKMSPDAFILSYSDGTTEIWEWKKILDGLLGLVFREIAPSDIFMWIFVEGYEDIMFSGLTLSNQEKNLVYFNLCEK
ncbi:MAG: hypothetical protein K8I00_11150 [Candidatus Omnitrophica bacterium]|nr:hypothetical protein [Candidatus Omnitrophota bacterium]